MRPYGFLARVINDLRARASGLTVGAAMAVVSFSSGFISYTHICALTLREGGSWKNAHLYPFCIDGQLVIGSAYFMYGRSWKSKTAGLLFGVVPGIAESLIANWESGIVHGLFAAGWATVPAQAFACSTVLFERWLHAHRAGQEGARDEAQPAPVTIPEAAPSVPEPAAPAAPAGAAPLSFPSPAPLPAARPRRAAAARPAPAAAGARPPLPEGEELAALLGDPEVSANEMSRRYDVSRWTANLMKKQYSEEMSDAAA